MTKCCGYSGKLFCQDDAKRTRRTNHRRTPRPAHAIKLVANEHIARGPAQEPARGTSSSTTQAKQSQCKDRTCSTGTREADNDCTIREALRIFCHTMIIVIMGLAGWAPAKRARGSAGVGGWAQSRGFAFGMLVALWLTRAKMATVSTHRVCASNCHQHHTNARTSSRTPIVTYPFTLGLLLTAARPAR